MPLYLDRHNRTGWMKPTPDRCHRSRSQDTYADACLARSVSSQPLSQIERDEILSLSRALHPGSQILIYRPEVESCFCGRWECDPD